MTSGGDDSFLGRWSRRKHAARRGAALPEPAATAPLTSEPAPAPPASAAAASVEAPAPGLPPVDSLQGLESEYQEFLRPDVDPATRSAALKKLFGDPHFNRMDGLDVYIDDYSKADPIPATMLRALNQARSLGLFEEQGERAAGEPETAPARIEAAAREAPAEPAQPAPPDEPATTDDAAPKTTGA